MASLIPGYEYDIFISYRQKDNIHNGWVTEFVDNLKGELESTFKEVISVYFDINPYDGFVGDIWCGCFPEIGTKVLGFYSNCLSNLLRLKKLCM